MTAPNVQNPEVLSPHRRSTPENLANIKDSLSEVAQTEKERVQNALERAKEGARSVEHKFEDYVRAHPVKSVLIAIGTGVTLGWLLGRRR